MEGYVSEREQVEALKKWFQDNGMALVAGLVLGLAALGGGQYWFTQQHTKAEQASSAYQHLFAQVQKGELDAALESGGRILNDYKETAYAPLSALLLAKIESDQGDVGAAQTHLRWVLENTEQPTVAHIARLRLAKILLSLDKSAEALALVNGIEPGEFLAVYEEVKGDIYVVQGQSGLARTAYQMALEATSVNQLKNQLQMKLDDLGPGDTS